MSEYEGTEQRYYTVSEAVTRCGVPSHVLRYWEDELGIPIERTAQGHRVYSEKDLALFAKVKEWKERGIQLKAIRLLLDEPDGEHGLGRLLGETIMEPDGKPDEPSYEIIPVTEADQYRRFEEMLRALIGEVVAEENERLEQSLAEKFHEEMEELYLQLRRKETQREAAAALERMECASRKNGILQHIRRLLRG
ncbi:MAG: MerR family transcriptional regulator [Lachnospiraceae bacterium]|nr:MerR family transcriptional regulator [Lachnospiraceae bacterium]